MEAKIATELVVVRHGETAWNADGRMQGQEDIELNSLGMRQSQALAERFAQESFAALYSSDLRRAYHTASIIADKIGHTVKPDQRLREHHLGIFQGLTREQAQQRFPQEFKCFADHSPGFVVPDGESRRQKYERVMACFDEIAKRHPGERILIVTHGGVLMDLIRRTFGLPIEIRYKIKLFNAGINCFLVDDGRWILATWGETCHLREISAANEL